jgi:hypothetical protein
MYQLFVAADTVQNWKRRGRELWEMVSHIGVRAASLLADNQAATWRSTR